MFEYKINRTLTFNQRNKRTKKYCLSRTKTPIVHCIIHPLERHALGCGVAETGEELQRIWLAEDAAHHRQACHPALHRVLLPDIIALSHSVYLGADFKWIV